MNNEEIIIEGLESLLMSLIETTYYYDGNDVCSMEVNFDVELSTEVLEEVTDYLDNNDDVDFHDINKFGGMISIVY